MKGGGQGLLITRSLNQRDLRSIRAVILNNPEAMQLLCPLPARTAALDPSELAQEQPRRGSHHPLTPLKLARSPEARLNERLPGINKV